ncbi:NAD(P)-dependent dehydrogenase (short-subunit alcohol dehydrogenase family) [Glaciihabitans tibetensis]|uniref:NAD(P)-dependent dehydrogenase (Short-subunit alcohol dehydrogenase family) n=1 Tax=Glaciihabitans tibetensis TaxID=1266600 RepID=A0A2T0VIM8_9MICO|nr:SDR family oxidoreductase [Glaciihabitans tibetensis]PRY70084.1 NAD(P)-dependent dehydrogenase (short-subunit alcohol dehydrogenase family) [Glaciihabitans tibetensis]
MVVTGAASGIGKATAELLTARGDIVIGVDLSAADVVVDLGTPEGRSGLVEEVIRLSRGTIDGIIAVAGLSHATPATVAVNYFGMVATLEGLRPLLARSEAPRAVGVASMSSLLPVDDKLVAAMRAGNEGAALARTVAIAKHPELAARVYASTKKAFAQWIRRTAATSDWAGANIPLNAIAPGIVLTPMVEPMLATERGREQIRTGVPMPLGGFAEPIVPARLLAWLAGPENTHVCGQVIFVDGGSDVVIRGDETW